MKTFEEEIIVGVISRDAEMAVQSPTRKSAPPTCTQGNKMK
jgi:hypothetical protein